MEMDKRGEELRQNMHDAIQQYGNNSVEALAASQILDEYMNEHYFRKIIKNERRQ
ncbi:hypothetical protein CLPUN_49300 [Clostridium puniceum]|uniref:Spo0E like sporulation regulatory protein n=1 Tax=Clostridium puniceum TaxID=29367 RepID=A0A1S8T1B4_9CLOT|nr:aspartyl-phosphate phosphatase Spo0E family protein [Clostridium puniceum]OOM71463.1 hypothetical protein CLPUN_49300 [Clostridium puniceum]